MTKKTHGKESNIKISSIVMIIISVLLVGGSITLFILSGKVSRSTEGYNQVTAEVVDFKIDGLDYSPATGWSYTSFAPTYRYEIDGSIYSYTDKASSSVQAYEIGDKVNIFVNPENPNDVITDSTISTYFVFAIFLIVFAVITASAGIAPVIGDNGYYIVVSLIFFSLGFAVMFLPGIASGYRSIGKILTAYLPATIIGAVVIAIGLFILASLIFERRKNDRRKKETINR